MKDNLDLIIFGDIRIELPRNNPRAILIAKKVLDLYLEDLLPLKRLITAKRTHEGSITK